MEAIVEQLRRAVEDVTAGQIGVNGPMNRSRVLDVSGVVQAEQEKKQQLKEEAIARRGERKSAAASLVDTVPSSPAIDERSRKLAAAKQRSGPVYARLLEAGEEIKKKQER
eukprot:1412925-Rhodomonas_salina.2